jgi:hypothetical protein
VTAVAFAGLPTNSRHETSHRYLGAVRRAGSSDNEHRETDSDRCGSDLASCDKNAGLAAGRPLVVVGLFTRQGRSSCPSANANLIKPTGATDVLTFNMRDAMIGAALSAPRSETAA